MINQLFLTKEITSVGCYAVKFVWKGTWREIIIDDYFPCRNNQPIFSKSLDNELWVLILEKAWAKLHGNYCQIDGGLAREVNYLDLALYQYSFFMIFIRLCMI